VKFFSLQDVRTLLFSTFERRSFYGPKIRLGFFLMTLESDDPTLKSREV